MQLAATGLFSEQRKLDKLLKTHDVAMENKDFVYHST